MTLAPRVVVVRRRTELDELLDRHGTRGQAEFFLRDRGRTLDAAQVEHDQVTDALRVVSATIPAGWRRGGVERGDLHRFLFDEGDIVVVVGQDGLVANVAKYLHDQPVIGVDPQPGINPGVLVRHPPDAAASLMTAAAKGRATLERRTMVQAGLDDGQTLIALNEIFLGHTSHQSARYRLTPPDASASERQSSSGLIVATGTGATGWCASIAAERGSQLRPPSPSERALAWFVREAWPSPATGTSRTEGVLAEREQLRVVAEAENLVVFGDGLEADRLLTTWGQEVTIGVAERRLQLVVQA
jgi:NAD kinase